MNFGVGTDHNTDEQKTVIQAYRTGIHKASAALRLNKKILNAGALLVLEK